MVVQVSPGTTVHCSQPNSKDGTTKLDGKQSKSTFDTLLDILVSPNNTGTNSSKKKDEKKNDDNKVIVANITALKNNTDQVKDLSNRPVLKEKVDVIVADAKSSNSLDINGSTKSGNLVTEEIKKDEPLLNDSSDKHTDPTKLGMQPVKPEKIDIQIDMKKTDKTAQIPVPQNTAPTYKIDTAANQVQNFLQKSSSENTVTPLTSEIFQQSINDHKHNDSSEVLHNKEEVNIQVVQATNNNTINKEVALPASTTSAGNQLNTTSLAKDISIQASMLKVGDTTNITLQLHPESLGTVQVTLTHHADGLQVNIVAHSADTMSLLSAHSSDLQQSLQHHFHQGENFVQVNVQTQGNNSQQSQSNSHQYSSNSADSLDTLMISPAGSNNISQISSDSAPDNSVVSTSSEGHIDYHL